jgi:hypothetical protein
MTTNDTHAPKQYTRIPAAAWNKYMPHHTRSRQVGVLQRPKLKLNLNFNLPPAEDDTTPASRVSRGTTLTKIDPADPSLKYAPREQQVVELPCNDEERCVRPVVEPLSPEIDPRILDGSWRTYVPMPIASPSPSSSPTPSTHTPVLTPVEKSTSFSFPSPSPSTDIGPSPSQPGYDIFLPTPLVNTTIASASTRTVWRTEPCKRLTVRLKVGSRLGELIKAREKRERKRERKRAYDREYRARKKQKLMQE